jgi:hypothetical protein
MVLDDLTRRVPGQAVMALCLAAQGTAGPRRLPARVFGARALTDDASPWFAGVAGERAVARMLDALGPEYIVMHSVPVSDEVADIDHIVIGPMGIVTINTKRHRDAKVQVTGDLVLVSGHKHEHVRTARTENRRVRAVLSVHALPAAPVRSLVVVVDAAQVVTREAPSGIDVIDAKKLLRTIRRMPALLDAESVWTVAAALSSASTWTDANMAEDSSVPGRFAELEHAVRVARVVRLAWTSIGCAVVAGGAVGAAMLMPGLLGVAV